MPSLRRVFMISFANHFKKTNEETIPSEFVKEAGRGGKGNLPLDRAPTVVQTESWDGKDGEIIEEDEFSLEELLGDDSASSDEL